MNLRVELVPLSRIHQAWPFVENFIQEALKWGDDDYTVEQAKVYIVNGDWMLLVAIDEQNAIHGAAAVRISNMPNYRLAFVIAIGGRLISNEETYKQLCNVLKGFGATKIRGVARDSIARLWKRYGFKERYILVEADI